MYQVEVEALQEVTEDEIDELIILYQTPVGTIPMERDKGIDTTFLSMPTDVAKTMYSVEIIKKTRLYSNFEVSSIDFSDDEGKIIAKVVVKRNE